MLRYRLRTLMIVLALGPLVLSVGVREWRNFQRVFPKVAERKSELAKSRAALMAGKGSRQTLAGVRHAQLRLARQDQAARRESVAYRVIFPVTPK